MTLYETLTAAVREVSADGYVSQQQLEYWLKRIRDAAEQTLTPPHELEEQLNDALRAIYSRMVDQGQIITAHQGVSRFTLDRVRPQLRGELNRRILASANLIKLNRQQAIAKTEQRFSGWATSIPAGGSGAVDKNEVKGHVRKALAQLPFESRRVLIDQGHKLTAALHETLARDGGALAMVWRSHWRQPGYNYRPDHKERDGHAYAIRGNWALAQGFMKAGPDGYYDDITKVAEEPFCRCFARWLYALRDLPDTMVTVKGRAELARVKELARAS